MMDRSSLIVVTASAFAFTIAVPLHISACLFLDTSVMLIARLTFRQAKMETTHMAKQLSKVRIPSLRVADQIDVSDMCSALGAAQYRFRALMRELEREFDEKASELRDAYLIECAAVQGD